MYKLNLIITILCLSCIGCIQIPNYQLNDKSSTSPSKFRYGKYCGAGHPSFESEPGTRQRTKDLLSIWPPVDDIDLLCFAHDMCYQETSSNNQICDQALARTAMKSARSSGYDKSCERLMRTISNGLAAKFWGHENDKIAKTAKNFETLLLAPFAAISETGLYIMEGFPDYPEREGECYAYDTNQLPSHVYISEFEFEYAFAARRFSSLTYTNPTSAFLHIKLPPKLNSSYAIFNIQKYLNYFGYNPGTSDGIYGESTRLAIKKFQRNKGEEETGEISTELAENLIGNLISKYINLSTNERWNFSLMSEDEAARIFKYP